MKKYIIPLIILVLTFLFSCNLDPSRTSSGGSGTLLPNVSGTAGEVLIVMDNLFWKGEPGLALKKILEQEYPALPQPEPLFDIVHIAQGAFDDLFKRHRTIIIVDIASDIKSPELGFLENVWARPQLIIRVNATDSESFISLVNESEERILRNIQAYDRNRLIDIFKSSRDAGIRNVVSKFHINLAVPRGYQIDIDADDFAMFSIETPRTSQVICIYTNPLTDETDISTGKLIENRDAIMRKYTKGSQTGSHMITAPLFPPQVFDIKKQDREIIELRGLWELNIGFMGGPFMSHTVVDKNRDRLVTVEGYVFNPNEKKRNLMRHLEAIVYSMELLE